MTGNANLTLVNTASAWQRAQRPAAVAFTLGFLWGGVSADWTPSNLEGLPALVGALALGSTLGLLCASAVYTLGVLCCSVRWRDRGVARRLNRAGARHHPCTGEDVTPVFLGILLLIVGWTLLVECPL